MTGPLLWDDPNHDIGADMVVHLAGRVYDNLTDEEATAAAAERLRVTFTISAESAAAALRQIREAAAGFNRDVGRLLERVPTVKFPASKAPAWKRVQRRWTATGGPVTELDLDIDFERVADVVTAGLDDVRIRTRAAVQRFDEFDERLHRERYRTWPRGNGKTGQLARDLENWSAAYEAITGAPPEVVSYGPGPVEICDEPHVFDPQWLSYQDVLDDLHRQEESDERRRQLLAPYLDVVTEQVEQVAGRLRGGRAARDRFY